MLYEELTRRIIGCAMEVHRRLGNGFQACLPKGSTARRQEVMASTPLSHRLPGADSTFEIIRYEKLYESTHSAAGVEAAICAFQNVHVCFHIISHNE